MLLPFISLLNWENLKRYSREFTKMTRVCLYFLFDIFYHNIFNCHFLVLLIFFPDSLWVYLIWFEVNKALQIYIISNITLISWLQWRPCLPFGFRSTFQWFGITLRVGPHHFDQSCWLSGASKLICQAETFVHLYLGSLHSNSNWQGWRETCHV